MTKNSLKILKLYSERSPLSLDNLCTILSCTIGDVAYIVSDLFNQDYLEINDPIHKPVDGKYTVSTKLQITQHGRNHLSDYKKNENRERFKEFRNWLSFAIALAAFIKSFFF